MLKQKSREIGSFVLQKAKKGDQMSEAIVVAGISLAGTLCGTWGGIMTANRLTAYRIEQLERKVEKHNSVIERVFKLEERDAVMDERISQMEKEIERG
jgi:hypothetical protein